MRTKPGQTKKFGNEIQYLDGYHFGSKLETSVYQMLKLRQRAGEIVEIQCQDHIYLSKARIGYIPDFKCLGSDGKPFWVEAKGYANDRWPTKKKLWKHYGPGKLEIWMGSHIKPYLDEEILPVTELDTRDETISHLREKVEQLTKQLEELKSKVIPQEPWPAPPPDSL